MDKLRKAELERLKADRGTGPYVEENVQEGYRIKIIYRGEHLFYQQGERALICAIDPIDNIIYKKSLKHWDNGKKISDEEKKIICDRIIRYFKVYQKEDAIVAD
ncbi:MAG: hypothetical protein JW795_23195 [Chitinivibrionales bacterium]|nr:hypothetical protein [Chitinivibrionales bacterium]